MSFRSLYIKEFNEFINRLLVVINSLYIFNIINNKATSSNLFNIKALKALFEALIRSV